MRIQYPMCKVTLGGWLSMFNGIAILTYALFVNFLGSDPQYRPFLERLGLVYIMPLSLPLAVLIMFPSCGGPTVSEVISSALILGINCFAWGYGLEYLLKKAFARTKTSEEYSFQNDFL